MTGEFVERGIGRPLPTNRQRPQSTTKTGLRLSHTHLPDGTPTITPDGTPTQLLPDGTPTQLPDGTPTHLLPAICARTQLPATLLAPLPPDDHAHALTAGRAHASFYRRKPSPLPGGL